MTPDDRQKVVALYSAAAVQVQRCGVLMKNLDSGEDFSRVVRIAKSAATAVDKLHSVLTEMNLRLDIEKRQEELENAQAELASLERKLASSTSRKMRK
jgi:hypothetical protein